MATLAILLVLSTTAVADGVEFQARQHRKVDYEPLPPPEGAAFTQMTHWDVVEPHHMQKTISQGEAKILIDAHGHVQREHGGATFEGESVNEVAPVIRRQGDRAETGQSSSSDAGKIASQLQHKVVDKIVNNSLTSLDKLRKQFMNSSALSSLDRELRQLPGQLQRGPLRQLVGSTAEEVRYRLHIDNSWRLIQGLLVSLVLSFFVIYHQLRDASGALFYSQPAKGQERLVCEDFEPEALLQAFNRPPSKVNLRIVGRRADSVGGLRRFMTSFTRKGLSDVAFDVSLDLAPFVRSLGDISQKDAAALIAFSKTRNPLEILTLSKRVEWEGWHEVSDNIYQRLRELGFEGDIDVILQGEETVHVMQNQIWPKFLRCPLTQVLLGITVVGGILFLPYIWLRTSTTSVQSRFKISLKPTNYWDLIGVGVSAEKGFHLK